MTRTELRLKLLEIAAIANRDHSQVMSAARDYEKFVDDDQSSSAPKDDSLPLLKKQEYKKSK